MTFILHPWKRLIFTLAGWINRHQQEVIEDLRTENQVLKEKLGQRRILTTPPRATAAMAWVSALIS